MFRFQKLEVWQKAVDFANIVYSCTNSFPSEERYGLTAQMRRASISISSNIAEGSGRVSDKDFARFIEIAYGSLMEVISQSRVAVCQKFLEQNQLDKLQEMAVELARMLSGLRNRLLATE